MSAEQIDAFGRDGYLVVEDAVDRGVLDALHAEYSALMDRLYEGWRAEGRVPPGAALDFWGKLSAAYAAGCDWFQPMDCSLPGGAIAADTPMHFGPAAFDMITHPRLLDIVERLIGPEITSNPIQHIRIKPPQREVHADETRAHVSLTDWHQDRGVTLPEADRTDMVTVWLAITDVTLDSAPLQVIPGGHRGGLIEHCGWVQTGIPRTLVPAERAVPLPCRAGAAVIFHPLTPHASLPNRSDVYRWSFDIRFNRTGQPTGRDHFPSFTARSRARPETELHDWRMWREMWQAARARLSGQPHVPIHRWDTSAAVCA
ncbi:phytanoyl-CoA dioxygenase [Rhodobacteraceae bacterium 2CG4]|uniref:Phytanoyl-CoA dioxygenase n=1 Tax=Halovulum marinum TaxID=2662447 RepID=A0A6L5YWK4_9RHOB|nr:phytanoyl-CoA dioxygenase [Halovulum marinum]